MSIVVSNSVTLNVGSGTTDSGVNLQAGGLLVVSSGGVASGSLISSGAIEVVLLGGLASGTTVRRAARTESRVREVTPINELR